LTTIDCYDFKEGEDDFYQIIKPSKDLPGYVIVVLDTGTRRSLTEDRRYNERVELCKTAAGNLAGYLSEEYDPELGLSQISHDDFQRLHSQLPDEDQANVATHVFDENVRSYLGNVAWRDGDLVRLGQLVNQSGDSLHEYFGVGSDELRFMTEKAREVSNVYGARQVGAGFAGCVIALADPEAVSGLEGALERYKSQFPQHAAKAAMHVCKSDDKLRIGNV